VRVVQPEQRIGDDPQVGGDGEPSREPLANSVEGSAVEKLHHHEVTAAVRSDFVRLNDIGVTQSGSEPGFVQKHGHVRLVARELRLELLDDHELTEASWALHRREIDVPHAPPR